MKTTYFPADQRGTKDSGWLKSNFFFSFSNYCDPVKSAFGTLFAFNDDFLQTSKGFGIHPHVNMEIISVLLKGKMNHKDSMGYSTTITEGGVQIMSAGSGLFHEEYNIGDEEVNFLQIWIYPKVQNVTPRYQLRHFPKETRKNKLTTIISSEEGIEHCWINQNARLSLGDYETAQEVEYHFNQLNECLFVFIIEGEATINGTMLNVKDGLGIWDTGHIKINCANNTQFLIIETPINQK